MQRLKKSYDKLVSVTQKKISEISKETDIKIIKDALATVKEEIFLGQMFTDEQGNYIQIMFEGEAEEFSG